MLTQTYIDLFLKTIALAKMQMESYSSRSWLYHIEARFTLFCLERYLLSPSMNIEHDLIEFFKRRWKNALINTDIQYLHDVTNPANQACVNIARALGKLLDRPYLGLLMPTLLEVSAADYTTSSYIEDDLLLTDLILNDSNNRIIHLSDVLANAQVDGILKYNFLVKDKVKTLSETEKSRFLSRDSTVGAHYQALKIRVEFKVEGDTVGAALTRLIQGLRDGGSKKTKQEEDSGHLANQAIVEFHEYVETLDATIREQLMKASKYDRFGAARPELLTVETLWGKLSCDKQYKFQSTHFCVELIANGFEEILKENPWLYDLVSYWGDASTTLSELNAAVVETRAIMESALPHLEQHVCYGEARDSILLNTILEEISVNHNFLLSKDDVVYFVKQYVLLVNQQQNIIKISEVLKQIAKSYPEIFMPGVLDKLDGNEKRCFRALTGIGIADLEFEDPALPHCFFQRKRLVDQDSSLAKRPCLAANRLG